MRWNWNGAFGVALCSLFLTGDFLPAQEPEQVNYTDHVLPLVRRRCGACHNGTDRKGGLALDSYSAAMAGGSSGPSLAGGEPQSSYLWSLVNHESQPKMPPMSDKLPDTELAMIRRWIEQGLKESSGSEAKLQKRSEIGAVQVSGQRPAQVAFPQGYLGVAPRTSARANAVTALAVSPWAPLLAVSGHQQIALYHTVRRELLGILPFPEGQPHILRFSRDGSLLLAGGGRGGAEGRVVLFDVTTGHRKAEIGSEYDVVLAADISPDHSRVALGGPKKVLRVFSTATGQQLHQMDKHTDWITAIEFSPDGALLASADRSNGLQVWETVSGRPFHDLPGHTAIVTSLSWRLDSNLLASGSEDSQCKLWEMNDGKAVRTIKSNAIMAVSFARDGRLLTTGRDRFVRVWNTEGKQLAEFGPSNDLGMELAVDNENNFAICGDWTGAVRIWNLANGKEAGQLSSNPPALSQLVADAEQKLAALEQSRMDESDVDSPEMLILRARLETLKSFQPPQP